MSESGNKKTKNTIDNKRREFIHPSICEILNHTQVTPVANTLDMAPKKATISAINTNSFILKIKNSTRNPAAIIKSDSNFFSLSIYFKIMSK